MERGEQQALCRCFPGGTAPAVLTMVTKQPRGEIKVPEGQWLELGLRRPCNCVSLEKLIRLSGSVLFQPQSDSGNKCETSETVNDEHFKWRGHVSCFVSGLF